MKSSNLHIRYLKLNVYTVHVCRLEYFVIVNGVSIRFFMGTEYYKGVFMAIAIVELLHCCELWMCVQCFKLVAVV